MAESKTGVCPDWAWHNNSNVHLAVDRQSFLKYTPFKSSVSTGLLSGILGGSELPVYGVGTVEIPVKVKDKVHRKIRLNNVVHVPDYVCNILGSPIFDKGWSVSLKPSGKLAGSIRGQSGQAVAALKAQHNLFCLVVSGPPKGPVRAPSRLKDGRPLGIGATWPEAEQARWHLHYRSPDCQIFGRMSDNECVSSHYTKAETAYIKEGWRTEFNFLRSYGLSVYKDGDRDEGRAILRGMMARDDDSDGSSYFTGSSASSVEAG